MDKIIKISNVLNVLIIVFAGIGIFEIIDMTVTLYIIIALFVISVPLQIIISKHKKKEAALKEVSEETETETAEKE